MKNNLFIASLLSSPLSAPSVFFFFLEEVLLQLKGAYKRVTNAVAV